MRRALAVALLILCGCEKPPQEGWQGYVEGEFILLASPYAGQLQKLYVRRGDMVDAGKPGFALEQDAERAARLEAEERLKTAQARLENLAAGRRAPELDALRAELAQARAARDLAASQLAQQERLFKSGFNSQARLDEAKSAHARDAARVSEAEAQLKNALQPVGRDAERKAARAEVEVARAALTQAAWRLEQKSVAAPAAARVHDTFFVEGEWVAAGRPVASLLPPDNLKVRFYIPEAWIPRMAPGSAVEIRCDGCPAPLAAKVAYVSAQAEYTPPILYSRDSRSKLLFLVEARADAGRASGLRPGQPVDILPGRP